MRWSRNEDTRAASGFVAEGRGKRLTVLAASSYVGGVLEAMFLVLATKVAFAINDGVDAVEMAGRRFTVNALLVASLLFLLARTLLAVVASKFAADLMAGVVADTRRRLMRSYVTASFATQSREKSGALHELMTTYSGQSSGMISGMSKAVIAGANLAALVGLAFVVDPRAALLLVLSIAALGGVLAPLRGLMGSRSHASADAGMDFATAVSEVSELALELHAFDVTDRAADRVQDTIDRVETRANAVHFVTGLVTPIYSGLAFLALIGALGAVSTVPSADLQSLGAVTLLMLRSLSFGQALQSSLVGISTATPYMIRTREMLERYSSEPQRNGAAEVGRINRVEAHNVSFAYPDGPQVLDDLNFTIEPAEIIGIVGPSGAGKSTIVQLLLGLRSPTAGMITANGTPIERISASSWARRVAIVPQKSVLISGSVRDNIAFYRNDLCDDDIVRAAKLAQIHDEIAVFPDGYDRQVGTHGGELSGGQQQRICIARAIAQRPDVLILDEPTSSLDVRSEQLISDALRILSETVTIVVIAHRLSTLGICDRIMVVQGGTITAFDQPGAVEAENDFFRSALVLSGMRG